MGPLISEVIPIREYDRIYGGIGASDSIASILSYPDGADEATTIRVGTAPAAEAHASGRLGIIGAGNFTKMTMLPALKGASIKYIASSGGVTGTALAKKYNIQESTTDYRVMLEDPEVSTVLITTRHDSHARMVTDGLRAGKHVFVEKPMALHAQELEEIISAQQTSGRQVTVGFNRRFSPHAVKVKSLIDANAPKNMIATMNAGHIPADVWVHDLQVGGGRIVGEACHFIDLLQYFSDSPVAAVCMSALGNNPPEHTDNAVLLLKFQNGDQGVINYFANGSKAYAKERVEVYCQEKTLVIDNWRITRGYGVSGFSKLKTKLDKGHKAQFTRLAERAARGGAPLIPFADLVNTTRASFAAIESLKEGKWIEL